jgi:hypothetical protein
MKSFTEYLTESKKTYEFKIKVAGDLSEGFSTELKSAMEKFAVVKLSNGKRTPIQEVPLDFPNLKNSHVTVFDLEVTGTTTLTSAQAANTIQEYSGTLTSNQIIIVPSTVQLYTFTNNSTGAFSLTIKTSVVGGATVVVPQGDSLVVICDGTNCYNAASGSSSSLTSLTLGNGSLAVPSLKFLGDLNTGLYLPATGQLGFVINNALAGYFSSAGFFATNGIKGGGF